MTTDTLDFQKRLASFAHKVEGPLLCIALAAEAIATLPAQENEAVNLAGELFRGISAFYLVAAGTAMELGPACLVNLMGMPTSSARRAVNAMLALSRSKLPGAQLVRSVMMNESTFRAWLVDPLAEVGRS